MLGSKSTYNIEFGEISPKQFPDKFIPRTQAITEEYNRRRSSSRKRSKSI